MEIDVREIIILGQNCREIAQATPGELTRAMTRSVIQVEADAKRAVPTDTHNLQRSITHTVQATDDHVVGKVGTNVPYAQTVEDGRRAGAAMPPAGALLGWMGRKSIPAEAEYVIRRAIGRRGIPGRPYLRKALAENASKIDAEFKQVIPRLLAKLRGR